MRGWKLKVIIAFVAAVVGGAFSEVVKPYIEQKLKEKEGPVLTKTVDVPDLKRLPKDIQTQVALIPIEYRLAHRSGGTAKKITVSITGSEKIDPSQVQVNSQTEHGDIQKIDDKAVKVEIPSLRPNASLSIRLLTLPSNEVKFSQAVEEGSIVEGANFQASGGYSYGWEVGLILGVFILWCAVVIGVLYFAGRLIGKLLVREDGHGGGAHGIVSQNKAIQFLMIILIYNFMRNMSFMEMGEILGILPAINMQDIFFVVMLYYFITRFHLFDHSLLSVVRLGATLRPGTGTHVDPDRPPGDPAGGVQG
jgi:hypothetical protein